MEMFYFTLGVLSILATILIVVLILGMLKVYKIQKDFIYFKEQNRIDVDNIHRLFEDFNRRFYKEIDVLHSEIHTTKEDSMSYTDRRIDKSINQIKEI